jgi:hypothetical protein
MAAAGKAAAGRPKMGEEKLIIRSEKVRLFDILSLMILRRPITSYAFIDVGDEMARDIGITPGDIFVKLTEIIQKVLASIYTPAKWLGIVVEFLLNFVALNGGLLGILWNIVRCTYPRIYIVRTYTYTRLCLNQLICMIRTTQTYFTLLEMRAYKN